MRTTVFSLLIFSVSGFGNVNPTLDGKISTHCLGGLTYQIQVEIVVPGTGLTSDSISVEFGDGNEMMICEADFTSSTSAGGVSSLLFVCNHTYSPGSYMVFARCGYHIGGILNIPSSAMLEFCLQAFVAVDPNIGCNSSPIGDLLLPEIEWSTQILNVQGLSMYDPEGDSVAWHLYTPMCVQTGTADPAQVGGGTFSYSAVQQNFSWSGAQIAGAYTVLFYFEEFRRLSNGNYVLVGSTTREVLIDINNTVDISTNAPLSFTAFPNPANTNLSVTLQDANVATISDLNGQCVLMQSLRSGTNEINVSSLAEGVYILQIGESSRRISIVR